jgi:hypothetical protein
MRLVFSLEGDLNIVDFQVASQWYSVGTWPDLWLLPWECWGVPLGPSLVGTLTVEAPTAVSPDTWGRVKCRYR